MQEEKQWFYGTVTEFITRNGRHTVKYDDDDEEHLVLATEIFEWVTQEPPKPAKKRPAETPKAETSAAADTGDGEEGAAEGKDGVRSSDPEWPRVGDMFWGRVKVRFSTSGAARVDRSRGAACLNKLLSFSLFCQGHGWWPARCVTPPKERDGNDLGVQVLASGAHDRLSARSLHWRQ